MDKRAELLKLAKLRQSTRLDGYNCIGDYHSGAYECDFVSPYTKTAGNVDAEIMVILQDWASDEGLRGPFSEESAKLGHTPHFPTNRNLSRLLNRIFGLTLRDIYGTNVFPFVKLGGMSASIPQPDLIAAARQFALPEIRIVNPKLVICLGLVTFNALRQVSGLSPSKSLPLAIESPFNIDNVRVWCQAHTGAFGQNNRNRVSADRVSYDWLKMKADYESTAKRPVDHNIIKPAAEPIRTEASKRPTTVPGVTRAIVRTDNKMNLFILNNKAFERKHREIYPLDNELEGFALYDYDERQIARNPDLNKIQQGDLALVFGKDRTVKDIYRVTGTRARYAADVKKDVFVIYGVPFGSLDKRVVYSQFVSANKLSCSRVDHNNNFTIGMLITMCTHCQNQSIEELATSWQTI